MSRSAPLAPACIDAAARPRPSIGVGDRDPDLLDDALAQIAIGDRELDLRLGVGELRLDVERERDACARRPASCSRCRSGPSWRSRPSPERLRRLACVSNERPLPTFFTVRYIVTCSPFWTRPSPLPLAVVGDLVACTRRSGARARARVARSSASRRARARAASSNFTLTPSLRDERVLRDPARRAARPSASGAVEPTLWPSTSHQPSGDGRRLRLARARACRRRAPCCRSSGLSLFVIAAEAVERAPCPLFVTVTLRFIGSPAVDLVVRAGRSRPSPRRPARASAVAAAGTSAGASLQSMPSRLELGRRPSSSSVRARVAR